ncbi:hypothetical protein [Chitinophaga sp.]|uniref:hypothetical protein n=1 Tax=Chitinophaga sp. TaxID=1869181 RepID=UPI002F95FCB0
MADLNSPLYGQRDYQIMMKRNAIERKLSDDNRAGMTKAIGAANKSKKNSTYSEGRILGQKEGFTNSDFGVGAGAAIPYQVANTTKTVKPGTKVPAPPKNIVGGVMQSAPPANAGVKTAAIARKLSA